VVTLAARNVYGQSQFSKGSFDPVRIDVLTKEYPPEIYGGAGVHVAELVKALRRRSDVEARVHAFGGPRDEELTTSYPDLVELADANAALKTLGVDLSMADGCAGTEVVHSHTWYANMAGHLASLLHGVPHVISAHSLEPLRPWKAEQLGGGYAVSSWVERTAYEAAAAVIAVSAAMRDDVLRCYPALDPARVQVVHNGIDTDDWSPVVDPDRVRELGVDPDRPSVVFVGRITRQKGLPLFLRACAALPPDVQIVLCAGAPDTPEIEAEVEALAGSLAADRTGVVWIREMLPRRDVVTLLTAATVFACPSIYEPLGIVNLEAMACETAVVATATGGIPEVVVDGETGLLVPIEQADDGTGTPLDPDAYVAAFAEALTAVVSDPARAAVMGHAGRQRAIDAFSWASIADRTVAIYAEVVRGA
jgi:starch synthase